MEEKKLPIKIIYEQVHATAENVGMHAITDDHCCKLLAWLYAFGGGDEKVTLDYKINTDIRAAQRRLCLIGGETPNAELLPMLRFYIKQVEPYLTAPTDEFVQPEWVKEICKYYGLKVR